MRLLLLFLLASLTACGQSEIKKPKVNPEAKRLNDSAFKIIAATWDYQKGLELLDLATRIDSNYFLGFSNKLAFQLQLKRYNDALISAKQLVRIRPNAPEPYTIAGVLYCMLGDTVTSKEYFQNALIYDDKILDTMNKSNKERYATFLMGKAINLILIGEEEKGKTILRQLYEQPVFSGELDKMFKENLNSFINKSRREIIASMLNPEADERSVVAPVSDQIP